jgi:hypothetical protein
MKKAVVTLTIGPKFDALARLTHPTLKAYADRIGADFIVLSDMITCQQPHWSKFLLYDLLPDYDRIIFLDTDIIVRDDCPDLTEIVPPDKLGMFNEGKFVPRLESLREAVVAYKEEIPKWDGQSYYNSGVMVVSKQHRTLFKSPEKLLPLGMYEQGYINLRIFRDEWKMFDLPYPYNRMTCMDDLTGDPRHNAYIVHYAGAPDNVSTTELMTVMQNDLEIWKANEGNHEDKYPRNIVITVGGGLGDQIDAEPVVRYIKDIAFPVSDMIVRTDWPEIFHHLRDRVKVYVSRAYNTKRVPEYHMETMPSPETRMDVWNVMAQTLMHTTDFASLSCIRKVLPVDKKPIQLEVTESALDELRGLNNGSLRGFHNMILIHPGRGWDSKTFPKDWWQEVIDGIYKEHKNIGIIGKHISDEQGYVDVDCPLKAKDFRDMLTVKGLFAIISKARAVITNCSAPVHIAGAFDNWIIFIPTCKHPSHVLPWRDDGHHFPRQDYKSFSLYKKLTCDDISSNPTEVHGATLDWVKDGDIRPYLPDPEQVIKAALDTLGD